LLRLLPSSVFTRKDGTSGKSIKNNHGRGWCQITIVLWDEKVRRVSLIEKGTRIRVIGGSSRLRQNGGYESISPDYQR